MSNALAKNAECPGCEEEECDDCNPVTADDVICSECGEHSELREQTGTDCCGGVSRF